MSKPLVKKTIEIDRKRIPLRNLLHGKEIREAAKALEDFRMKLNEKEFLYGAKISVQWDNYGDVYAVARRPETDTEFADRIEKARLAAEIKKEREAKRKLQAEIRAREEEKNRKERAADYIRKVAKEHGISVDILDV
jgi:hypothetical protein